MKKQIYPWPILVRNLNSGRGDLMQHQITEPNGHGKLTDRLTTYISAAVCILIAISNIGKQIF